MSVWEELHGAITTVLKREIPEIQTCESYPVIKTALLAPAVLVELASFEPGNDPGTGEIALRARFEARIIVDSTIPNADFAVRALVSEVARVIHQNSWGMNVSPAEFLGASPDGFKPDLDAYMVWTLEWAHELHRGDSVWTPSGIQPHTIYVGIAPEIGAVHEPDYREVQSPSTKPTYNREFEGGEARRTAVYKQVHEDSSTDTTYKLPLEGEFGGRAYGEL